MLTLEALEIVQDDFRLVADIAVQTGDLVAVIGPSGGGKSTLLNAVAGFIEPRSGGISWQGERLNNMTPAMRPIAMVFQDNNLFPHLSAAQNVALGIQPSMRLNGVEKERAEAALERVGLGGMGERKPAALSGGQQSRVALARVLVQDKPLLLLDEPFAALGPALRVEMLDLVAELATESGATVLMVTHDPKDAIQVAGQTIYVEGGRVRKPVETGPLLDDPPEGLREYLGR